MDGNDRQFALTTTDEDVFALTDDIIIDNRTIADDHKAILDMSMLFHDLVKKNAEGVVVDTAVNFIEELVEGHCLREEKAMRAANYPRATEHAAKHARFRRELAKRVELHRAGDASVTAMIAPFLAAWFRSHIADDDRGYEPWIAGMSVDQRPLIEIIVEASQQR